MSMAGASRLPSRPSLPDEVSSDRAVTSRACHGHAGRRRDPNRPTPAERRAAEVAVLLVMVFWAGNFVVVKAALAELPPVAFTSIRFALGSLVLFAVCRWREGAVLLPRRDLAQLAVLGAIGFALYQALWTTALDHTTAADSALLIASTPIITALIAAAIGSDRLTPLMLSAPWCRSRASRSSSSAEPARGSRHAPSATS